MEDEGPIWTHLEDQGSFGDEGVFPRMSKIMDFNETLYSVRQKIGDPGSISIRNMFPLQPVTPKRPESPYGAKQKNMAEHQVFQFFGL